VEDVNLSLMDLVQAGNLGLMRAAELFNPQKFDVRFCTYSYISIRRKIQIAIKESHFIHLPLNHFKYHARMTVLKANEEKMSDEEIQASLGITDEVFKRVKDNYNSKISVEDFDFLLEHMDNGKDISSGVENQVSNKEVKDYLYEKLKELKPKEREVIFHRYFGGEGMTLEKTGKAMNLTRERIRQIEFRTLRRLRKKISEDRMYAELKTRKMKQGGK